MRIRACIVLCVLILVGVVSVTAQGDASFNAAVRAARAAKPDIGQVTGSSWARLNPTTLSNLHCPLVQGTDLGREVTVYEWTISFATGSYRIYASTDGTVTQLCDSKFGSVVASTPAPPSGCQIAAAAQPTFRIAPEPSTAILGGEVMTNGINYAIGRTDTREWYQTRNKANQIGWVSAKEVTLSGACDELPITGARDIDYMDSTCFITTAQDYSNVRETPSTDAKILAGIYENSYWQVYASAGADTEQWYFINTGWVAARVTEQYGQCDNLRYDPSLRAALPENMTPTATAQAVIVGTPAATFTPSMTATPIFTTTPLPADLACPADFEGFLEPRLTLGAATARVVEGGDPNRLRSDPTTQALQVGVAQPGRTLDMVLAGPACSGTYVWWFVRIDGVDGWTVESDSSDEGAYYLEPIGGASGPSNAPAVATANPTRIIAAPGATSEAVEVVAVQTVPGLIISEDFDQQEPIRDIRFYDENFIIAVAGEKYYQWDVRPEPEGERWTSPFHTVTALDTIAQGQWFFISGGDSLYIKDIMKDDTDTELVSGIETLDTPTLSITSDGRYFITVGCNDADCTKGKIDLWETATGKLIRSQPAHPGLPMGAWFTPDDSHILSMGGDGIQVWDTQSGAFVGGVALDMAAVTNMASNPVISSDSAYYYIAICTEVVGPFECIKTELLGWELATSKEVTRLELNADKAASALAISSDDLQLAVGFQGPTIQLVTLDPATTAYVQGNTLNIGEGLTVSALIFSPDNARIAVGTDVGTAQLWDVPQP